MDIKNFMSSIEGDLNYYKSTLNGTPSLERSPAKSKNNILVFPNRVANLEIQNTGYNMHNQEYDETLNLTIENQTNNIQNPINNN